jgi:NADH/F420H2 dehydrogenase subunit C
MSKNLNKNNFNKVKSVLPVLCNQVIKNEIIFIVHVDKLFCFLKILKNHIGYRAELLSCISGVDFLSNVYRFGVVYDFLSLKHNTRLRVKVFVNEITPVPSIINFYQSANWWEREIWDLYGIYFTNHLDLRRILTDYGFEGHPMRKDFPLSGYVELRYNEKKKRIVVEPIELTQEFRSFTFQNPW